MSKGLKPELLDAFLLGNDEVVTQIACGALHTMVSTNKNRIFSCGYGETYALGNGEQTSSDEFQQISSQYFKTKAVNQQTDKIDKIECGLHE